MRRGAFDWDKAKKLAAASQARWNNNEAGLRYADASLRAKLGGYCNKCGAATRERTRRKDGVGFFGCCRYPKCTGTWKPPPEH